MGQETRNKKNVERIILGIFSAFTMGLSVVIMGNQWESWTLVLVNTCMVISWILHVGSYSEFGFRAYFNCVVVQITMVVFEIHMTDIRPSLAIFALIIIMMGLYEIPGVLNICAATYTLMLIWHFFIAKTTSFTGAYYDVNLAFLIFSVYLDWFVVMYFVRKQRKTKALMEETIEELQSMEQSKDDFMANMSHELRTPINTICGMSEVVLRENLNSETTNEIFQIQMAGRNLLSVVNDILDFSELQSGKMDIVNVSYNITSTINDVINLILAKKSEKRLELVVDCNPNLPSSLLGDEGKIRRIIMNLMDNAIKFTDEGCVMISFDYRQESYGINLVVTVRDTGIGISEENLERLFSTFNQADSTRSRQKGGIGIGLAIASSLTRKMGGFVTVKSKLGKGSDFQFVIPQKVLDERPIAEVRHPQRLNVAVYIFMEQFPIVEIRDAYTKNITSIVKMLNVKTTVCHNLAELKRRLKIEYFTHLFISLYEYNEDREFFDELSKEINIIIVLDREQEADVTNINMQKLLKPFFILPIVHLLNGENKNQVTDVSNYHHEKFIAPEARILVVDDNEMNVRVAVGLLKSYQLTVDVAYSGAEAIQKVNDTIYDLIFMDHMMPEMDGVETLHNIRQKGGSYHTGVPIIALTANAIGGAREMFLEYGFQEFVPKPIEISVLERVLREWLPKPKVQTVDTSAQNEDEVNEEKKVGASLENEYELEDIVVEQGISYCGSVENYKEILQLYVKSGDENLSNIEKYFDSKDWSNYAILVHALKSSMKSIGANPLSDMALGLEMAAKKQDADYIVEHHNQAMEEYHRILEILKKSSFVEYVEETLDESLILISEEEFKKVISDFEDASYMFDVDQMMALIQTLEGHQYQGHSLKELIESVNKKIEMSDYFSAATTLKKYKEKMDA